MHSHKLAINVFMPPKSYIFTIIKKVWANYNQIEQNCSVIFELKSNEKIIIL